MASQAAAIGQGQRLASSVLPRAQRCPVSSPLPAAARENQHLGFLSRRNAGVRHCERLQPVRGRGRRRDPVIAPGVQLSQDDMVDLYGYLLRNRIIFVGSRITDEVATQIVASLMALELLDDSADIRMYINSGGGSPYAITAILDTMRSIKPDICTIAMGQCVSTSTLLLAGGTKGKRFSMPSTRIMMHQPAGGAMGSSIDVLIQATELNRTLKVVHSFFQEFTGLPMEVIQEETDRDNFMSPARAMELGIIDGIIEPLSPIPSREPALAA